MLSDGELRRLAHFITLEQASNEEWMRAYAKATSALSKKSEVRLVSPKYAAEMLGISVWQLYRIKDDEKGVPRFSYIKSGSSKSSTLKFDANKLLVEYERYVSSRR